MVVESAVGHQKDLSARHLAVDDSGDVHTGFADQVAAQLDDHMRARHLPADAVRDRLQVLTDGRQVQRLLTRKVRNAEPASEIEKLHRRVRMLGQPQCQFVALELRLADRFGTKVLRSREEVETFEGQSFAGNPGQHFRHHLHVHAELLRATTHLHARALELEVRIHAHGHAGRQPELLRGARQHRQLAHRLEVDKHTRRERLAQLRIALAGAGEADLGRITTRVERHLELTRRSHVNAVHHGAHEAHHGRHRVGLHGVVQLDAHRQGSAQLRHPLAHEAAIVGVEGRLADTCGQRAELQAANDQFAVPHAELAHRRVDRAGLGRCHRGLHFRRHGARARQWKATCGRSYRWGCVARVRAWLRSPRAPCRPASVFGTRSAGPGCRAHRCRRVAWR